MSVKLFVGGLSFSTSSEGLRGAFARFGQAAAGAAVSETSQVERSGGAQVLAASATSRPAARARARTSAVPSAASTAAAAAAAPAPTANTAGGAEANSKSATVGGPSRPPFISRQPAVAACSNAREDLHHERVEEHEHEARGRHPDGEP